MTRVVMGPRASGWWIAYRLVFGAGLLVALSVRRWDMAALALAILLVGLVTIARSLQQQLAMHLLACGFAAASTVLAATGGRLVQALLGVLAVLVLVAIVPSARREGSGGRIRTEELVGLTVPQAERLLGYPRRREPRGLALPVVVPVPFGPRPAGADPASRAQLVVTSVAVDPAASWIAFGVAPLGAVPPLDRRGRAALQAELVSRVGGFSADLRSALRPDGPERRTVSPGGSPRLGPVVTQR
ncbi:hypothetical protein [Tsukamurella pseudospumae]|nr:hypothetical protein [Tsukamurella pseudospumae]